MRAALFAALAIISIQSLNAAVVICNNPSGSCGGIQSISDVTSANEAISVSGRSADFVDTSTFTLSLQAPTILKYIPTKIFNTFPKIQSVSIFNASITNLVTDAFASCGLLTFISLNQNDFPDLPASFASTCINVTSINFMQNNIKTVHQDAFKGMTFLSYVMLRDNEITCIPPGTFQHTPVITSIDLVNNKITKLDPTTFRGLPSLSSLMIGSNQLASIPAFDFTHTAMTMGLTLMMENNPIDAIHPQFLTKLFVTRQGGMMSTMITITDSYGNLTTCIPKNNMYLSSISSHYWPMANLTLRPCYEKWGATYETPVSCAPLSATTPRTNENGSDEDLHPWAKNKNFIAIITNIVRNFTANVNFY